MTMAVLPLLIGFCVDLILGDPYSIPHPVVLIGKVISGLKKMLRTLFPKSEREERLAGGILWLMVVIISTAVPAVLLVLCRRIHPMLALVAESIMCWQILATKSLKTESMKVYQALDSGDLEKSRYAVSMAMAVATIRTEGFLRTANSRNSRRFPPLPPTNT